MHLTEALARQPHAQLNSRCKLVLEHALLLPHFWLSCNCWWSWIQLGKHRAHAACPTQGMLHPAKAQQVPRCLLLFRPALNVLKGEGWAMQGWVIRLTPKHPAQPGSG